MLITAPVLHSYAALSYTCDPNIDARHAGTCAYLNSTIAALYNNTFTNVNAGIYVQYGATELGESHFSFNFVTYSAYLAALTANSQSSGNHAQTYAASALNSSYETSIYGNYRVAVTPALGRALGFQFDPVFTPSGANCTDPGTGSCYDGIITITDNTPLYYRAGFQAFDAYDFYSVVEHETDEILGMSSCIDTQKTGLTNSCASGSDANILAAVDLFRYEGWEHLILASTTLGAYFSFDEGTTLGANGNLYNTLANGEDYGDFVANIPCQLRQSIQDATGCPGQDGGLDITNDGGAEINILNAIGYEMNTVPPPPGSPSISSIQNAATFQTSQQALAPNTYLAIFGFNLSADAQGRTWAASDFTENADGTSNIPTSLDGTSVTVGGTRAYIYYVSGTQLNILTPPTFNSDYDVPVVVTVNGQSSAPFYINMSGTAPSFFAYYPGTAADGKYLIAQHLPGYTNVGPLRLYPNAAPDFTTPARPGETIQLYGTGFGSTDPSLPAGIETPASPVYALFAPPTATVGGMQAKVVFAGLTPGLSLIYQFAITIPANVPNGDLPLVVSLFGVTPSFSGLVTVQGP